MKNNKKSMKNNKKSIKWSSWQRRFESHGDLRAMTVTVIYRRKQSGCNVTVIWRRWRLTATAIWRQQRFDGNDDLTAIAILVETVMYRQCVIWLRRRSSGNGDLTVTAIRPPWRLGGNCDVSAMAIWLQLWCIGNGDLAATAVYR